MRTFIITWTTGVQEPITGKYYINALANNNISPEMIRNIVSYKEV